MAHALEPKGIDKKIDSFTNMVSEYEHYMMPQVRSGDLEFSIGWLYIALGQYRHHVKNSQQKCHIRTQKNACWEGLTRCSSSPHTLELCH
jgi:hypothetical protein